MRSATWSRGFEGDGLSLQESISVAAHVSAAQRRRTFMLELVGPSESNAARRVDSMLAADQKLSAPRYGGRVKLLKSDRSTFKDSGNSSSMQTRCFPYDE
ncbi:hypothetical protein AXG93_138s1140 [Marchantia polymorpha subsp. ruderalis]|uniref:Uncharacterized protein n=1 Tax=Marchantia polymorpha subsp. ruderalis TaxID=1480154 RepID=A0A176VN52_MARPO|nr:hypothetical protein AXG93_138s1140 [Marchantia polymorpha subsp. ruderalis]